jgi:hypothetical protein
MQCIKVLFVDIDGVINTVGGELGFRCCLGVDRGEEGLVSQSELFDPACLYYLHTIVEETGCKIVISSTWRHGATLDEMKSWFKDPIIKEAIIDKTPSLYVTSHPHLVDRRGRVQRGEEIKAWVDSHPEVTRYAAIDDDSDMDIIYDHFFKTCTYDGLKKDVANKVILYLNNEEILEHYRMNRNLNSFLAEARSCFGEVDGYKEAEDDIINILAGISVKYNNERV